MIGEAGVAFRATSSDCLQRAVGSAPNFSSRALGWDNCEMAYWDIAPASHEYESREDILLALHIDPKREIKLQINGRSCNYQTAPGMITLVSPGSDISFTPDGPFRFYMLHLPSESVAIDRSAFSDRAPDLLLHFSHDANLRHMMSVILDELITPSDGDFELVHSLSQSIAHYLRSRLQIGKQNGSKPPWTSQLIAHIDRLIVEDAEKGASAERIAKAAGLSKNRLREVIKFATGLPPHKYILEKRLSMAEFMLWNSSAPLSEIALQVGFASQSHFTDSFHKARGITPLRYRNARRSDQAENLWKSD